MGEQLTPEVLAIHQWIRDDAPVTIQMTITPKLISALAERLQLARAEGPHPESGEWVMVPCQPSYKLVSDLATEWSYSIEEASESYQGFLDVVSRHGAAGSDPEAYEADRLADEEGEV